MMLPFSREEFLEVFGRYNVAVWPAQLPLYVIALFIVTLMLRREHAVLVSVLLAVLWLWMGVVYHLMFFSDINPAARLFGVLFVAQAAVWLWKGRRLPAAAEETTPVARSTGKVLVAYGLFGYPLIGYLAGQQYPIVVTLGLPCPTTIFTIGVLLWARRPSFPLLAIPIGWAIVGTYAATSLAIPQDYGLTVAALAATILLLARPSRNKTAWIETRRVSV